MDKRLNFFVLVSSIAIALIFASCASSSPAPAGMPYADMDRPMAMEDAAYSAEARRSETDRMVAYSGYLSLSVKNTDATKESLLLEVKGSNGFIVKETDYSITARVPTQNMDAFFNNAKTLGKIVNETKTGTDITDQYRDNVIRLENLKTVRDRYLALLDKAVSVTDILGIEKELERVNTQIEIMEGRIKYAEESVAYSNITVDFREKAKPGPLGWIFYGIYRGVKWLFVWK